MLGIVILNYKTWCNLSEIEELNKQKEITKVYLNQLNKF